MAAAHGKPGGCERGAERHTAFCIGPRNGLGQTLLLRQIVESPLPWKYLFRGAGGREIVPGIAGHVVEAGIRVLP